MFAVIALDQLPTVNACLNSLATLCLLAGWVSIRQGRRERHRAFMISAFCASAAFLTCYLIYHYAHPRTVFREPAWFKPIYLAILLTHTVLAVVILPLIFMTFWRALKGRWEAHKKIARWTLPLWLYVSVTGVLIYYLLYVKFPQPRGERPSPAAAVQNLAPSAVCRAGGYSRTEAAGSRAFSGYRPSSTSRINCSSVPMA